MAGRYKAYPEYKRFNSTWFDSLPSHWQSVSMKWITNLYAGGTPSKDNLSFWENGSIPWLNSGSVNQSVIKKPSAFITRDAFNNSSAKWIPKGSLVMALAGQGKTKGMVAQLAIESTCNQSMAAIVPSQIVSPRFLFWWLTSNYQKIRNIAGGDLRDGLNLDLLGNISCPIFECKEQQKIANFLDYETAKIDTLITKQEKLIELLKEKRQAVISHAVTKGLNPDAPMIGSGVEWLGDVPEHWEIKRLKHISPKVGVGLVINPSTYTRDEGLHFIFGGDVKEYRFDLSKTRKISKQDSDKLLPSRLNHRDLVSVRVGFPGVTAVVPKELEGSNCASVAVIRKGAYNSDWLCAAMNSWVGKQQVDVVAYGAAQKQFNIADAVEFRFPFPPIDEQDEIATYVEKTLSKFNKLNNSALIQIALLKERKAALTSAAVTGKIDVRDWQPSPTKVS
ncbi:restriction endonuclease subunit S [Vibrio parahaemolyticus]|nr:restriction endonuclease subunit S [Vibrio parahaemolyticus]